MRAELDFAIEAATRGAAVAVDYFRGSFRREQKSDGTWVTDADRAAESAIREAIARRWPEHNVLGEEEGLASATGGRAVEGRPTWVIDPIDGTNNFMAGIQVWATLIGLQVDKRNVVGVACAPGLDELYDGAIGLGARLNGEPIAASPVAALSEATVAYAGAEGFRSIGLDAFFDELTRTCWRTRGFGDFWGHMLVARGSVHAMVEPELNPWDVAALDPIVTEAGGRLTHLDGSPWSEKGSCLTTCGPIHDQIVDLVRNTAPAWSEGTTEVPSNVRPTL